MKNNYIIYSCTIFMFLLFVCGVNAQFCYQGIGQDLSGLDNSGSFGIVEENSCRLRDSIGHNFIVREAHLYLHSNDFSKNTSDLVDVMEGHVQQESSNYLLIVKESNDESLVSKVHVRLNLPKVNTFECLLDFYPNFEGNLTNLIESSLNANSSLYSDYYTNLNLVLEMAISKISEIKTCCIDSKKSLNLCTDCVFSEDEIIADLLSKEFEEHELQVPISFALNSGQSTESFYDFSNVEFILNDSITNKTELWNFFTSNWSNVGVTTHNLIITDDNNYCDSDLIAQAEQLMSSGTYTAWVHISLKDTSLGQPVSLTDQSTNTKSLGEPASLYFRKSIMTDESEWNTDSDDDSYTGSSKEPFKAAQFEQVAKDADFQMTMAYKNSTNSSLRALQKNSWASKWDDGFVGTAGEAQAMSSYFNTILGGTGVVHFVNSGDFQGAVNNTEAAAASTKITHAPDKRTDFTVDLGEVAGANGFVLRTLKINTDMTGKLMRALGYSGVGFNYIEIDLPGKLLVEVKYSSIENMYSAVQKAIVQLQNNPGTGVPVIVIDDRYYHQMMNNLSSNQIARLEQLLKGRRIRDGGVDGIVLLNKNADFRLKNLVNAIKARPDLKPPSGYF